MQAAAQPPIDSALEREESSCEERDGRDAEEPHGRISARISSELQSERLPRAEQATGKHADGADDAASAEWDGVRAKEAGMVEDEACAVGSRRAQHLAQREPREWQREQQEDDDGTAEHSTRAVYETLGLPAARDTATSSKLQSIDDAEGQHATAEAYRRREQCATHSAATRRCVWRGAREHVGERAVDATLHGSCDACRESSSVRTARTQSPRHAGIRSRPR